MIGNDIVDTAQAKRESNWQRRGFLEKLFTTHEQGLILSASNPERLVWTLWSMKESAYKVSVRETGKRAFAPKKLICSITSLSEETVEGTVFYQKAYQTKSSISPQHIATVAILANTELTFHQEIIQFSNSTYQHQNARIQEDIQQYCVDYLAIPPANSYLQKDQNGIPALLVIKPSGEQLSIPISISHHGHYGSFVIDCTHRL
ncbi:4'-phosphopantetheinyl transferase family protein [Spirosoma foliorum]|uniref:4-phosphopantetheinyl transferase family protein n=1 Tax=Spirosoma foliorum TaxID=2710596 RepID=A0A7G5GSY5_9BACT|nr:4'-phosphopantetheinyl transferase superfamily protein [Spirosoma foliorum]QMW01977.1 4-phosphopantetheinyl transferase family protein [Spirosoma foliorum]